MIVSYTAHYFKSHCSQASFLQEYHGKVSSWDSTTTWTWWHEHWHAHHWLRCGLSWNPPWSWARTSKVCKWFYLPAGNEFSYISLSYQHTALGEKAGCFFQVPTVTPCLWSFLWLETTMLLTSLDTWFTTDCETISANFFYSVSRMSYHCRTPCACSTVFRETIVAC